MKTTTTLRLALVCLVSFLSISSYAVAIYCPDDVWVDCDAEIWDLSIYGNATYWNGWDYVDAGEPTETYYLNSCNTGYIKRKWSIEDPDWNIISCHQHIYVEGGVFDEDNITWPESPLNLDGCNPNTDPSETGFPSTEYVECSLVGTNYNDMVFYLNSGCKKLIRTWTVIDWCTYNPNLGYGSPGSWQFSQTIKISNSDEPQVYCLDEVLVNSYNCSDEYVNVPVPEISESACGGSYMISHNSPFADQGGPNASGTYPVGTTRVKFSFSYGCGLTEHCYVDVVVKDNAKPVPYCLMSLVTALMPIDENQDGVPEDGMVEIWAKDFDHGSYHPCNYGPLEFSFSEDTDSTFAIFTCEHIGTNELKMFVTDPHGNQSYCLVDLVVQNNGANIPNCQPTTTDLYVAGQIKTSTDLVMENARVKMTSVEPVEIISASYDTSYQEGVVDSFYNYNGVLIYIIDTITLINETIDTSFEQLVIEAETDSIGIYHLSDVTSHLDYIVSAEKEDYPLEKVSIHDAYMIRDYIEGIIEINNPYFLLAADMDFNGEINYQDFYELMSIVRDPNDEVHLEDPYIIMNSLGDMNNLEEACHININSIDTSMNNVNFMAILRGDVSLFVDQMTQEDEEVALRSDETLSFSVFPNPFKDQLSLSVNSPINEIYSIELFSVTGQLLSQQKINLQEGNNLVALDNIENIPRSGIFILKVKQANEYVYQQKIIRVN